MKPDYEDQAAGLRRLLGKAPPLVVTVATCGAGAVRWLAGQSLTRAQAGRSVVALDEASVSGNLADAMGLPARFDLLQAVERHVSLAQARVDAGPGLSLYATARLSRALASADRMLMQRFADTCRQLQSGAELWLIHARPDESLSLSPLALAAHRLVVAVDGSARAITEAYALIKYLDTGPWLQIDLVLAADGRSRVESESLLANLIEVGHRQTNLALRRVFGIEASAAAAAVVSAELEGDRFLDRVLGQARRARGVSFALGG